MVGAAARTEEMSWTDPTCPVARTLDLVGDRWSLLIVRDAMDGARTFTDFQHRTGIARNILTDRLRRLVERGILDRQTAPTGRRRNYVLTEAETSSLSSWPRASGVNDTPSRRASLAPRRRKRSAAPGAAPHRRARQARGRRYDLGTARSLPLRETTSTEAVRPTRLVHRLPPAGWTGARVPGVGCRVRFRRARPGPAVDPCARLPQCGCPPCRTGGGGTWLETVRAVAAVPIR